jgi:Holliday junction resolvase RusA-like endonuclease
VTAVDGRARAQTITINDWLPAPLVNGPHGHWATHQKKLKAAQVMVWSAARQDGLEAVSGRAAVHIELVFPVKRRRDLDGLYARVKGCLDGLVKGGWIVDDSTDAIDLKVTAVVEPGHKATRITVEPVEAESVEG